MSGRNALQYQVSSRGVTTLRTDQFANDSIDAGLRAIMEQQRTGLFPSAYADTTRRGLSAADDLASAIDQAAGTATSTPRRVEPPAMITELIRNFM